MSLELNMDDINSFSRDFYALKEEIARTIKGCDDIIKEVLIAFFAGGHVLLEGEPGLGKTLLVKCLARSLGLGFKRIQFTPDLMPADILGTDVLIEDQRTGSRDLQFKRGPIFTHILLADEINRASPKTQSALLEAMGENQVTIFGRRYPLAPPFFVIATQNPIEMEGTYPLPEAQLDRFFFKVLIPFPNTEVLSEILDLTTQNLSYESLPQPILCKEELKENLIEQDQLIKDIKMLQGAKSEPADLKEKCQRLKELEEAASDIRSRRIVQMREIARGAVPTPQATEHILHIIEELRRRKLEQNLIDYCPGPRAAQALLLAGKVASLLKSENAGYTFPSDISPNILPTLRHRVILNFEAEAQQQNVETILRSIEEK